MGEFKLFKGDYFKRESEVLPADYSIEQFIRQKNGRCNNSKTYFKYWIPKKTYDLFEVAWISKWDIEFFTREENYYEIWDEFKDHQNRYGRCKLNSMGYDKNYYCYVVDIFHADLLEHYMPDCLSPYHYMGETQFLKHAHSLGYTNDEEIKTDWIYYHNNVGRQFTDLGLLPKGMFKDMVDPELKRKLNENKNKRIYL